MPLLNSSLAALETLNRDPGSAGELIFEGSVFPRGFRSAEQSFLYERRVRDTAEGRVATHLTRDAGFRIILAQRARFQEGGAFRELEYFNAQTGESVRVTANGPTVFFERIDKSGQLTTAMETVEGPLLVGPTMFDHIRWHWEDSIHDRPTLVRVAVPEWKRTLRLELKKIPAPRGLTRFLLTPVDWRIKFSLDSMLLEFSTATRNIVSYEGRVPPMRTMHGKLKAFDARVTYLHLAPWR